MLSLAFISEGFPLWELYIAEEQLFFAKRGLEVEVTHTGSSVKQVEGLESGLYDLGLQLPDHVIRSVERGSDLCIVAAQAHAADVVLVADPEITDLDQLIGKPIGVEWGPNRLRIVTVEASIRGWMEGKGLCSGRDWRHGRARRGLRGRRGCCLLCKSAI